MTETRLTANSIQYPARAPELRGPPPDRLAHAFRIVISPTQAVWLKSTAVTSAQLPAGAVVIDAPLAKGGLPNITITPGITSGTHNISGGVYKFLDDLNELGIWLNDKSVNNQSVFNRYLEQYDFDLDSDIVSADNQQRALMYTFQIKDTVKLDKKIYEINCEDVNRDLEKEIFLERTWRLERTITEGQGAIIATTLDSTTPNVLTDNDYSWQHGSDYHVHPDQKCGIALIEQGDHWEFFSYSGLRDDELIENGRNFVTFNVISRGLWGTKPREWVVSQSTPRENRLKITAIPYAEEDPLSLAMAVTIGKTFDGRSFPYNAGIDERWINKNSLVAGASVRRRTLRGHKKISVKNFLEQEILIFMPGVMTPGPDGALGFVSIPYDQQSAPVKGVINRQTCYSGDLGALHHDASDTKDLLQIAWDKHPVTGDFQQITDWFDQRAVNETLADEPATLESSTITTGRSTESEINALGSLLYSRHSRPLKRLTARPNRSLWHLRVCDTVRVNHRVQDYATNAIGYSDIDIPMMIGSITHEQERRAYSWQLVGYREVPQAITQSSGQLPDEAYTEGAEQLPGVVNGVAMGSPTINLNQKYFNLGALVFPSTFSPVFVGSGDFIFWNKGILTWAATIDLTGRGGAGGIGGVQGDVAGKEGEPGINPSLPSGGSVDVRNNRDTPTGAITRRRIVSRPPSVGVSQSGLPLSAPTVENGRILGIPATFQGSGGRGGDASHYETFSPDSEGGVWRPGSNGGNGSGGMQLVCDPGSSFAGDGELILNGGDAAATTSNLFVSSATGAPGSHGKLAVYHPGAGTPMPIDGTRLKCHYGSYSLIGDPADTPIFNDVGVGQKRSHYIGAVNNLTDNQWQSSYSVQYLPASQEVTDSIYSSIDLAFLNQEDNSIDLLPNTGTFPSDANPGDMTLLDSELQGTSKTPQSAFVMNNEFEWVKFDWENDPRRNAYRILLANNREDRGSEYFNTETRPTTFETGDRWRQPSSGLTWRLERFGPPDQLERVDDARVSDNRNRDPEFTDLILGGTDWVIRSDIYALPNFALEGPTVALSPMIVNVTYGGSLTQSPATEYDLSAVSNIAVAVYSDSSVELTFSPPANNAGITGYEVYRDNALVATIPASGPFSHLENALTGSTTYAFFVRPVGANSTRGPDSTVFTVTTDPTMTAGNTLNPVTGLNSSVYSSTAIELFWTPPTNAGVGTSYEIYKDGQLIQTINDLNVSSFFESQLIPSTTYVYGIKIVGGGQQSDTVTETLTTNA